MLKFTFIIKCSYVTYYNELIPEHEYIKFIHPPESIHYDNWIWEGHSKVFNFYAVIGYSKGLGYSKVFNSRSGESFGFWSKDP